MSNPFVKISSSQAPLKLRSRPACKSKHKNTRRDADNKRKVAVTDVYSGSYSEEIKTIPDEVEGEYTVNYNIAELDNIVRAKLKRDEGNVKQIEDSISSLKKKLETPRIARLQREIVIKINELNYKKKKLLRGDILSSYIRDTEDLVQRYKQVSSKTCTVTIGGTSALRGASAVNREDEDEVVSLIECYLQRAGKYMKLNIKRIHNSNELRCVYCKSILIDIVSDDDSHYCQVCHAVNYDVLSHNTSADSEKINAASHDSDSPNNFTKALERYQGLQKEPDAKIDELLDEYFTKQGEPTGEEIRKLPLNKHGRRGNTDHDMLWNALFLCGLSDHYKDDNLIGHRYWGWELPNIFHLVPLIEEIYAETQKVYMRISAEERGRSSSLNVPFHLWAILKLVGYPRPMSEFRIAIDSESLCNHIHLWKKMVHEAGYSHLMEKEDEPELPQFRRKKQQ